MLLFVGFRVCLFVLVCFCDFLMCVVFLICFCMFVFLPVFLFAISGLCPCFVSNAVCCVYVFIVSALVWGVFVFVCVCVCVFCLCVCFSCLFLCVHYFLFSWVLTFVPFCCSFCCIRVA